MNLDQAIQKAMKLLRLSKSPNAHEAALAAQKAQEVIDTYKLDVSSLDYDQTSAQEDNEPVKDFGYEDPLEESNWSTFSVESIRLASTIAFYNQTCTAWKKTGDGNGGVQIRIVGRASDVQTVRYLYGFYKAQILQMVKEHCKGNSYAYRREFFTGVVDAIAMKIKEGRDQIKVTVCDQHQNNPLALVRVEKAIARLEKRGDEAAAFMQAQREKVAAAYKAAGVKMRSGSSFRGGGGLTGGRAHGQREGKNIRTTGASASLGSGQKQIG